MIVSVSILRSDAVVFQWLRARFGRSAFFTATTVLSPHPYFLSFFFFFFLWKIEVQLVLSAGIFLFSSKRSCQGAHFRFLELD